MLASIIIQFIGLLLLSIAMKKHAKSLLKGALSELQHKLLRITGYVLLTVSYLKVAMAGLPSIDTVAWLCYLAINIVLTAIIHSYFYLHPRRYRE